MRDGSIPERTILKMAGLFHKQDGVAGIEFAILAPVLLLIAAGCADFNYAFKVGGKLERIAATLGGLFADAPKAKTADVDGLLNAGTYIIQPFSPDNLKIVLSALKVDENGQVHVTASRALGTDPLAIGSVPPVEVPDAIREHGTTIVLSQVDYAMTTPFSSLWPTNYATHGEMHFSRHHFAKPRAGGDIEISE